LYLEKYKKEEKELIRKIEAIDKKLEFVVLFCLGLLLIILFNPFYYDKIEVGGEEIKLLFLLGVLLLISLTRLWRYF
jgi:hypothetical protein